MIHKIEIAIDVIIHATEDISKIFQSFNDVLEIAQREGGILIGLSPEGTRKKAEKWKSGFLRIAPTAII